MYTYLYNYIYANMKHKMRNMNPTRRLKKIINKSYGIRKKIDLQNNNSH